MITQLMKWKVHRVVRSQVFFVLFPSYVFFLFSNVEILKGYEILWIMNLAGKRDMHAGDDMHIPRYALFSLFLFKTVLNLLSLFIHYYSI
jgi:hypothetical protein